MSALAAWPEFVTEWLAASFVLVLIVKLSVVLASAWLMHAMLANRNPRWRVALWRSVAVGLASVAVVSLGPPIVTYRFAPAERDPAQNKHADARAPDGAERVAPSADLARIPVEAAVVSPPSLTIQARNPASEIAPSQETNPAAAPAALAENAFLRRAHVVSWLWRVWLAGVLLLSARLIAASVALTRIVRRSSTVPDEVSNECRIVSERMGCREPVRVRQTAEITIPCVTGLWHPVVLLPLGDCEAARIDGLRAILAHELGHVHGHDVFWNSFMHFISVALWFHPLVWRIRPAHAAACDIVCDAVAADLLDDVASYSRTLARLALQAASRIPLSGLAMARSCDVRRRIEALNRAVDRSPLPRKFGIPALLAFGSTIIFLGGFSVSRAERSASKRVETAAQTEAKDPSQRLVVRAISAGNGKPIANVSVGCTVLIGGKVEHATNFTAEDGTATFKWAPGIVVNEFHLTARALGFVPIYIRWDKQRRPIQLPQEKDLRFEEATTIGGIVQDEAGRPIEGASVDVVAPATEHEKRNYFFSLGSATTDPTGRWQIDTAPKNLAEVSVRVTHPQFQWNGAPAARGFERATVLKKGLSVSGTVVDGANRPVRGAQVILGHDIWGTEPPNAITNEQGNFFLNNCNRGGSIVTVQSEEFAPQIQDVRVDEQTAPVAFRLTEPAAVLRVRIVDVQGKPVPGVSFGADTWRGHRSVRFRGETGPDGRIEWRSAPKDVVFYYAGKADFMWIRDMPLTATEREQTITLHPKLVITGRVTEAGNGHAVSNFRVVKGRRFQWDDRLDWSENKAVEITSGQYQVTFDEPRKELLVKIEATGYKPAVSRSFRPDEGSQTFDAVLERDVGVSGIVVLPDGRPAAGAEVALSAGRMGLQLREGRFDRNTDFPKTRAGPDGRFWFPARAGAFDLIALSDDGYAQASSVVLAKSGKLVLQPWRRIEGFVQIGPRIGVNQEVMFEPARPNRQAALDVRYWYGAYTDDRGRFQFDHVVPGTGTVSRVVRDNPRPRGAFAMLACWPQHLEIAPGRTAHVKIGGTGRPLVGRIALDGTPESPVDWTLNKPVLVRTRPDKPDPRPFPFFRRSGENVFASFIDKEGRFRIEDVPAGQYELTLAVEGPADPRFVGSGREIGSMTTAVNVPEIPDGRSNQPLDLGTITAKLFDVLKIGDRAPDFDVERIGVEEKGQRFKLSDFRGRLVLLNFWVTRGYSIDMTVLREVEQSFGNDPRFVLVSLALGDNAAEAEKIIKKNGMSWTHGFAGDFKSGAAANFKIINMRWVPSAQVLGPDQKYQQIPLTFLVGPDGRIVGHDFSGGDLEAVRKALDDPKLFPQVATHKN